MKLQYLLIGVLIFCACSPKPSEEKSLAEPVDSTDLGGVESFGVTYIFSDSAQITANLFSAHVQEKKEGTEKESKTIHYLDGGVKIHLLNPTGQVTSRILSERGIYERSTGRAELYGNVVVTNSKGEKMETERLYWNEKKDSIFSDTLVRIETPDKIIIGREGLKAKGDFSSYQVLGVQGELEEDIN